MWANRSGTSIRSQTPESREGFLTGFEWAGKGMGSRRWRKGVGRLREKYRWQTLTACEPGFWRRLAMVAKKLRPMVSRGQPSFTCSFPYSICDVVGETTHGLSNLRRRQVLASPVLTFSRDTRPKTRGLLWGFCGSRWSHGHKMTPLCPAGHRGQNSLMTNSISQGFPSGGGDGFQKRFVL